MSRDGGLRQEFRKHLPGSIDWQAIETGETGRGVPDSNFCNRGIEGWIEFKACDAFDVGMRPEQVGWISRRVRRGGRVWIAIRLQHDGGPRKGVARDALYLYHGSLVEMLDDKGLKLEPYAVFEGGPARWDWKRVHEIMVQVPF